MGFSGTDDEALTLVKAWRTNNQDIVRMWARVQEKAKDAYYLKKTRDNFYVNNGHLFIKLLSGRHLIYRDFQINEGKMSYNRVKNNKYIRVETYGGKLVENIVQATARDLLFAAMLRLDASGYKIVLHVHDEVVIEQPIPGIDKALKDVIKIMCQSPDWAKGWDIRCSGLISPYYRK
jgi:DNA polymerase